MLGITLSWPILAILGQTISAKAEQAELLVLNGSAVSTAADFRSLSAIAVPKPAQSETRGFHFVYVPPDAPKVGTVWGTGILGELVVFDFSNASAPVIVTSLMVQMPS